MTCVRDWLSCETMGAKSGLLDNGRREHLSRFMNIKSSPWVSERQKAN